jgi:hypothetical protein
MNQLIPLTTTDFNRGHLGSLVRANCWKSGNGLRSGKKAWFLYASVFLILGQPIASHGALITENWISKDKSKATLTLRGGESIKLPKKGGGDSLVSCGGVLCTVELADCKDKKGKVTYDNNLAGLQAMSGTIDEGFATFEITTTGNWVGLFASSSVTARLVDSTGFIANIGFPGDQIPQGASIDYSTRWFSDDVIGIDADTLDEVVLGNFFLDSISPLSAFEYHVVDSSASQLAASFTIGEQYRFSTGLEITGDVTKEMITVPEPGSWLLLGLGLISLFGLSRKNLYV